MNIKDIGEFGLIEEIRKTIITPDEIIGIGDDCAVIPQKSGVETLVSTDMLIEGTHFLIDDITPYRLGWKSAAVNISDIAAMGGRSIGSFLSFALPKNIGTEWISEFFRGYNELSSRYGCLLLGGDTTSSPDRLCISITVIGEAPSGSSVKRCNAKKGDLICVTGHLGDSACGLKLILEGCHRDRDAEILISRHYEPYPRIKEGMTIASAGAHSMMDISDGIGSDLRHILKESGVGAEIYLENLPVSAEMQRKCDELGWDPVELAVSGGEDYELLFTISPEDEPNLSVEHYIIGRIIDSYDIKWKGSEKNYSGYRHF